MTVVYGLVIGLVLSVSCVCIDRVRRFGIGGLVLIILVSGVIWVGYVPLA